MRALYLPGQGFRIEEVESLDPATFLTYDEARRVSPLFEGELYDVLIRAQAEPWVWQED